MNEMIKDTYSPLRLRLLATSGHATLDEERELLAAAEFSETYPRLMTPIDALSDAARSAIRAVHDRIAAGIKPKRA